MCQSEMGLNSNNRTRIVFGSRTVARADELPGKLTTVERRLNGLLDMLYLVKRRLRLRQHAPPARAYLGARQFALLRKIGGSLGQVNEPRWGRGAVAVCLSDERRRQRARLTLRRRRRSHRHIAGHDARLLSFRRDDRCR